MNSTMDSSDRNKHQNKLDSDLGFDNEIMVVQPGVTYKEYGFDQRDQKIELI
jgi:hypothetical protein